MTSREAITALFSFIKKEPVIVATGYLCRTTQAAAHREANFYMIGSMGMASSIGLGAALSAPKKKIIVLDGDGAVLMNLGHLPMAGAFKTSNLIHIVLDNGVYESTGGQPSLSGSIPLEAIAKNSGYLWAKRVKNISQLKKVMPSLMTAKGPAFLLVRVVTDSAAAAPRVSATPKEITASFMKAF